MGLGMAHEAVQLMEHNPWVPIYRPICTMLHICNHRATLRSSCYAFASTQTAKGHLQIIGLTALYHNVVFG